MGLRIHTNLLALGAANRLEETGRRVEGHLRRLGSGLRITSAADDPAGLARSERLDARRRSTNRAASNAQDAIAMVRTMEHGLARMSEIGIRLREIALQAANGTTSPQDLTLLDNERALLADELSYIAKTTRYNDIGVLSQIESYDFLIGPDEDDRLRIDLLDFSPVGTVFASYSLFDEEGLENVHNYSGVLIDTLSGYRGFLGGLENRLESVVRSLQAEEDALIAQESLLRDADVAREVSGLQRERVVQGLQVLVLAQANVNHLVARELLDGLGSIGAAAANRANRDATN